MVGKLEFVPLRKVWNHEAYDFTNWLYENLDVLGEHLGFVLNPVETEKSVGPFSVDILAEDANGKPVIIENQLEKTNHDHLGKLLTYLANLEAKIAIWISTNPRPEHVVSINFLNENIPQDTKFYLVKVQAFQIGNSDPAPLFTIEAGPSEEMSAGGRIKKEIAAREQKRYDFFEQLLDRCNQETRLFSNISPQGYQYWLSAGAGFSGMQWQLVIPKRSARVELFLCDDAETNTKRFDYLFSHKDDIEEEFGDTLDWSFKEERKQQYIRKEIKIGGLQDEDRWVEIQDAMIDTLIRMEKSLSPYLKNYHKA
jgi:hypothetical protein